MLKRKCECAGNQKIVLELLESSVFGRAVWCRNHGLLEQRCTGAASDIADLARRILPRNEFLKLAQSFANQMADVLENELFLFDNEKKFHGSLKGLSTRARQVSDLLADEDFRQCGDAT